MFAPEVDGYVDNLKRINYRHVGNDTTYDAKSYELIGKIFEVIKRLKPVKWENRELWLRVPRGDISAFGSFEEWQENGEVDTEEEFIQIWQSYYPNEFVWYNVVLGEDNGYKAIFVNNRMIVEDDPQKEKKSWPMDISELVEWLLEAITQALTDIETGEYNKRLETELPYECRVGTIRRKDYYSIFPDEREEDFNGLTEAEEKEFLACIRNGKPQTGLEKMTANDFFCYCSAGYKANGYEIDGLTPVEQYKRYADGRDGGLLSIVPNSPETFAEWLESDERMGCHPWEVCRGGNSTHIDLYVHRDNGEGYSMLVRGSSIGRFAEAVRFFLSLWRMGVPVWIYEAEQLVRRITGEELIGIVPHYVLPRYCGSWFAEQDVIDYIHLPEENRETVISLATWTPLRLPILFEKS